MPETLFTIRWPDGTEEECYSPSTVVAQHFAAGMTYSMDDFLIRARKALNIASQRVEAKFGYACSSAMDQLARIEARAAGFDPATTVDCLHMRRG